MRSGVAFTVALPLDPDCGARDPGGKGQYRVNTLNFSPSIAKTSEDLQENKTVLYLPQQRLLSTMKRNRYAPTLGFLLFLCAVINPATSYANGVNLICKEKSGIEMKKSSSYGRLVGESKSPETEESINDFWSIPAFVDTNRGTGTIFGKGAELSVEPGQLVLREQKDEQKDYGGYTKNSSALTINRKDLSFSYASLLIINTGNLGGVSVHSHRTRKTTGTCTKVITKGNKI